MAKNPNPGKVKRKKIPPYLFYTDGKKIEKIFQQAVRDALRIHKKLGNPVAASKDGKVVIIQPEDIPVD